VRLKALSNDLPLGTPIAGSAVTSWITRKRSGVVAPIIFNLRGLNGATANGVGMNVKARF